MEPLDLRLVTSSQAGPCSAAPLTQAGAGTACDLAGETTYQLGESLGVVTPASASRSGQGPDQTIDLTFGREDTDTLAEVTGEVVGSELAMLAGGRVISAPVVMAPIEVGAVQLSFGSASEADTVAAALGLSATS